MGFDCGGAVAGNNSSLRDGFDRCFANMLPCPIAGPGIALCFFQPFDDCASVKGIGGLQPGELTPADRGGDRGALACPWRIRSDGGGATLIAQPVDEDAALALGLAGAGDEALGITLVKTPSQPCGKALHLAPVCLASKRGDHMDALAAR